MKLAGFHPGTDKIGASGNHNGFIVICIHRSNNERIIWKATLLPIVAPISYNPFVTDYDGGGNKIKEISIVEALFFSSFSFLLSLVKFHVYGPLYRQIRPLWYHLNRRAPNTLMTREKALWKSSILRVISLFNEVEKEREREREGRKERKIEKSSGGRRLDSVNRNREQLCPFVRSWPLHCTRSRVCSTLFASQIEILITFFCARF